MSTPLRLTIAACAIIAVAMIALIIKASLEQNLLSIFKTLLSEPWGVVTLVDLYAGFLVIAIWISLLERSALRAALWILALLCLGNLTTLAYVLVRARRARSLSDIFIPSPSAPRSPAPPR